MLHGIMRHDRTRDLSRRISEGANYIFTIFVYQMQHCQPTGSMIWDSHGLGKQTL